jgi:hypothetical protein
MTRLSEKVIAASQTEFISKHATHVVAEDLLQLSTKVAGSAMIFMEMPGK